MALTLRHRGPDDGGAWVDANSGIGFGHRRLSIVDLSADGHQPMVSNDGRYVMAFNGEVYNYKELQVELEACGHTFRGHSDTEVMLAAVCEWGLEKSLQRFSGMFAFALWNSESRVLHLVRDRMGEKPLYYGWCGTAFVFASELRALVGHPGWSGEIDRAAVRDYLSCGYVLGSQSIYSGIRRLPPGTRLLVSRDGIGPAMAITPVAYWSLDEMAKTGKSDPFRGTATEAVDELQRLLLRVVGREMVADVPVGAFLSGGIDSSTIVALMQATSRRPVKTFTIGFHERAYDEAGYARKVATHLGSDHTELYVSSADALAVIPRLPSIYDEPFADESQIPTFLVSQLARRQVTVSLSGDGGDELFGGYDRYARSRKLWTLLERMPGGLRGAVAGVLRGGASCLRGKLRRRAEWLGRALPAKSRESLYCFMMSHRANEIVMRGEQGHGGGAFAMTNSAWRMRDYEEWMMYTDSVTYLPDDILVKVDRASMAVSLESRVPLLDHQVVEFAWRLPPGMKVLDGTPKWVLRQLLYRYLPEELVERPKMGFGVPLVDWLRGPLRDWGESLLDPSRLKREGLFDVATVRRNWDDHLAGRRNLQYALWAVLMFQAWAAEWRPVSGGR